MAKKKTRIICGQIRALTQNLRGGLRTVIRFNSFFFFLLQSIALLLPKKRHSATVLCREQFFFHFVLAALAVSAFSCSWVSACLVHCKFATRPEWWMMILSMIWSECDRNCAPSTRNRMTDESLINALRRSPNELLFFENKMWENND